MKRMCFAFGFLLLCVFVLAGCEGEPPPPPPPPPAPPPPPPTPQEIEAEIRGGYEETFNKIYAAKGKGTQEDLDKLRATLTKAKQKHKSTEWGRGGLLRVANQFERKISEARKKKQWRNVYFVCEYLEVLEPGHEMVQRSKDYATAQLTRPVVKVTGNYEQEGETIWFLHVKLPKTGKTHTVKVRPGEEFHGLRFVQVLGDNRSLELEYQKLHETFTVKAP
jgi:hypothetical protein